MENHSYTYEYATFDIDMPHYDDTHTHTHSHTHSRKLFTYVWARDIRCRHASLWWHTHMHTLPHAHSLTLFIYVWTWDIRVCHAWDAPCVCVFNVCLSFVSFMCVFHVCLSCVSFMCVFHVCLSRVSFMCVFHVCLSCVSFMWESTWSIRICHVTYTKSERVIRLSCVKWDRHCMLIHNLWYQVFCLEDVKKFGYKLALTKISRFFVEMCETDTMYRRVRQTLYRHVCDMTYDDVIRMCETDI